MRALSDASMWALASTLLGGSSAIAYSCGRGPISLMSSNTCGPRMGRML